MTFIKRAMKVAATSPDEFAEYWQTVLKEPFVLATHETAIMWRAIHTVGVLLLLSISQKPYTDSVMLYGLQLVLSY